MTNFCNCKLHIVKGIRRTPYMYGSTVHYIILCTLYTVHCTLYSVQFRITYTILFTTKCNIKHCCYCVNMESEAYTHLLYNDVIWYSGLYSLSYIIFKSVTLQICSLIDHLFDVLPALCEPYFGTLFTGNSSSTRAQPRTTYTTGVRPTWLSTSVL